MKPKPFLFIYDGSSPPEIFSAPPPREPPRLNPVVAWSAMFLLGLGLWGVIWDVAAIIIDSLVRSSQ